MSRLLIDFAWLFVAVAIAIAFVAGLLNYEGKGAAGITVILAILLAGQLHAKRGGGKLEPGAAWMFGFGAGLITYAISFAQVVLIFSLGTMPEETLANTPEVKGIVMAVLLFISILTVFAGRYFINFSIKSAMGPEAKEARE